MVILVNSTKLQAITSDYTAKTEFLEFLYISFNYKNFGPKKWQKSEHFTNYAGGYAP